MIPYFRIFCTPANPEPELIDIDNEEIRGLLKHPPCTREGGWVIWDAEEIVVSNEGLEAVCVNERRLFAFKNGHIEYWQPCLSEYFQWSQNDTERARHPWLYPYAICELPVNFITLANLVYEKANVECDVVASMAFYSVEGFILIPYRPRSIAFIKGRATGSIKPYGKRDIKTMPVTFRPPCVPDHIAFDLVKQVYHDFGFGVEDIYLFDAQKNFNPNG